MLAPIKQFFSATENSIQGYLSAQELFRSILTALGSGTTIGVVIMVLQGILTNVSVVFPNPAVASMATVILTLVLDILRRQSQGNTPNPPVNPSPTPTPTPTPAPAPSPAPAA